MKKIFLLAMIGMINGIQADDMSDAIRKCDKEKVQLLLSKKKLTDQQIIKYLDTAEQTVRFRRDALLFNKSTSEPDDGEGKYALLVLLSAAGFAASCWLPENLSLMQDKTPLFLCGFGASFFVSGFMMMCTIRDNLRKNYNNSLAIKEMLYDSVAQNQ